MAIGDALHYIAIGNPVSKAVISTTGSIFSNGGGSKTNANSMKSSANAVTAKAVNAVMPQLWRLAGRNYNFVRIAGLSGAAAVIIGAIGSHSINNTQDKNESKIFETANRFHFFHSIALLAMPLVKYPMMTGTLMIAGTCLFSGTLYYRAFTGDSRFSRLAPIGGTCLIVAWLSLLA